MVSIIYRDSSDKENGAKFTTLGRTRRGLRVALRAMGDDLSRPALFPLRHFYRELTPLFEGNARGWLFPDLRVCHTARLMCSHFECGGQHDFRGGGAPPSLADLHGLANRYR